MKFIKIKSYAKINISLGVLGKLKSKLHKIESLIAFLNFYDEIFIKKIKNKEHKVVFIGKFSKGISKSNTIIKLLRILDNQKILKNQKYFIKINKKIPQKSGLGGGSMNAASIFKYLLNKQKIKLNQREILMICSKIGSDVAIGMQNKTSILYSNGKIKSLNNKNLKFYTLSVRPNFGCSTKSIYRKVKNFSRPIFKKNNKLNFNNKFLSNIKNDLEIPAFHQYPALKKIKIFLEKVDKVLFVRMTGSGSTIVGYFNSKKTALNAKKILKKNYKSYLCILSKTI